MYGCRWINLILQVLKSLTRCSSLSLLARLPLSVVLRVVYVSWGLALLTVVGGDVGWSRQDLSEQFSVRNKRKERRNGWEQDLGESYFIVWLMQVLTENTRELIIHLLVFPKTYTLKADPKTNCSKKPKLLPLSLHSGPVFIRALPVCLLLRLHFHFEVICKCSSRKTNAYHYAGLQEYRSGQGLHCMHDK